MTVSRFNILTGFCNQKYCTSRDLIKAQHETMVRSVPALYILVLCIECLSVVWFSMVAPVWLVAGPGLVLAAVCMVRFHYWTENKQKFSDYTTGQMHKDLVQIVFLAPALSLSFSLWVIALMQYSATENHAAAILAIFLSAIATSVALAALPVAAVLTLLFSGLPTVIVLYNLSHQMAHAASIIATLTVFLAALLVKNFRSFAEIVLTRSAISGKHAEAQRAKAAVSRLAYTDALTELPNRRKFSDHVLQAAAQYGKTGEAFVVAVICVDRINSIANIYGGTGVNSIIRQVAERIIEASCTGAVVARLARDEFAILHPGITTADQAKKLGAKLQDAMAAEFLVAESTVQLTISCGFMLHPSLEGAPERILTRAARALGAARAAGTGEIAVYSKALEEQHSRAVTIEKALRRAIANGDLEAHFQPIVDIATGRLSGFESLARWTDPHLGPVSPAEFVTIAERTGLIEPLTYALLASSARAAKSWPAHIKLNFNLSAKLLTSPQTGLRMIAVLGKHGLHPSRLEIEITETAMMQDLDLAMCTVNDLKAAGASLALDDFGTGFSSLGQIRDLPLDKVKIDKSFVDEICTDKKIYNIVRSIISLCSSLDLICVAEGIESECQLARLEQAGCHRAQGYLFSRPLTATAALALCSKPAIIKAA